MKKGFTLIELLIVITIIGILAVAFLPSIMGAPQKARDAARIATVNSISEKFAVRDLAGNPIKIAAGAYCIGASGVTPTTRAGDTPPIAADFEQLPKEPLAGNKIYTDCEGYSVHVGDGTNYKFVVLSKLENATGGNVACPAAGTLPNAGTYTYTQTSGAACYGVGIK